MNNETILKDFIDQVWNNKKFEAIAKFVDPEYTIHFDTGDPWEGKTINHEEFIIRLNYSFNSFPDIHFLIKTIIADGNYVAITWIMTGTNLGNIADIAATNKPIKTVGTTIYHFKNSKVCGHCQVFDRTTVMKQLGFLP
jgi:predicted ester cyclase